MHRKELLNLLAHYRSRFMEEEAFVRRAIEFVNQHEKIFDRETPVHVTGSAWVVSPDREQVLLMHHRKLNQWFQPGGHADGDADILRVALRECAEETGLDPSHIRLIDSSVFDVDIHTTPPMGNTPLHEHIDIRFVVEIDDWLPIPGNDESHAVEWFPLYQVLRYNNNRSTYRMLEKTRGIRNFHRNFLTQEWIAGKVAW
ncbi:MAG: NUDIX hydrolase [Gammaproteobacteria bacterium]|jgi:8-oxo-dGTP pyrophosphatase MutT (NUDIX family)